MRSGNVKMASNAHYARLSLVLTYVRMQNESNLQLHNGKVSGESLTYAVFRSVILLREVVTTTQGELASPDVEYSSNGQITVLVVLCVSLAGLERKNQNNHDLLSGSRRWNGRRA